MNALARFEDFVEQVLEGSVTQFLRVPVQPAEMAKRLERAMEMGQRASVVKILVPTRYRVLLHPQDFDSLAAARTALEREMARFIVERAEERGFQLLARPRVLLEASAEVRPHRVRVEAELVDTEEEEETGELDYTPPLPRPALPAAAARLLYRDLSGQPCEVRLDRPQVSLGRARDNDVILDDPRVSRYHARIVLRYGQYLLQDLGSTHGTAVNDTPVRESVLRSGDRISLGGIELYFEET